MRRLIEQAKQRAIALEQMLDLHVNTLVRSGGRPLEPLEIRNAILGHIERQVIPGPNGTRMFPYNLVTVELLSRDAARDAALEATLEGDGGLEAAARQRVVRARTDVPRDFALRVTRVPAKPDDWHGDDAYRVRFDRVVRSRQRAEETRGTALVLAIGSAMDPATIHRMAHGRMDIGRVADVRDREGRLVRRNALVISDAQDPNGTVSRRHAHVKAVVDTDGRTVFSIFDDGSRYGTRIVRNGETISVHPGSRGVRLQDGDELHVGEVVAAVRLE
jgi:hypothetical protein